jgi:peptidoglycan/xylan/chitin deacetylase (PgdA/CDA1 family)
MKLTLENGKQIEIVLSFDDGRKQDIRLADILTHYELPAIFYIPSQARELTDQEVIDLADRFSIGGHTRNHKYLSNISLPEADCEIIEGKEGLEKLLGFQINSFCYPRGRFTKNIKDFVRDAGFKEARTTRVLKTKRADDPYELDTTIHIYNRKEYDGRYWLSMALEYFNRVIDPDKDDDYFHLWGHSWEIDKFNYWADLDTLLAYMANNIR